MALKRKLGAKFVVGAAVCATAIAALFVYKPAPETIKNQTCIEAPTIHAVKGDGKCEVKKGEADPLSKNFDPDSCGHCGDDIRQVKSDVGGPSTLDMDKYVFVQDVTERPSETKKDCPADFHCGNGFLDRGHSYPAVVFEDGKYKISTIKRYESCNPEEPLTFCPFDCKLRTVKEEPKEKEEEEEVQQKIPSGSVLTCPYQIAATKRIDLIAASALGGGEVLGRISSIVKATAPSIREVLGPEGKKDVKISVSMKVGPSGTIEVTSVNALCENKPCENSSRVGSVLSLNLDGLALNPPGKNCTWSLAFRVP